MCVASYLIWFAHKEKQQLNGRIVIIHEFQLSEILTRADFYRDAQTIYPPIKPSTYNCLYRHRLGLTINPSIMPTAICEVVNDLIRLLSLFWLLANWYTKTFLDWACRYKEGHSQVIKVIGTNKVCRYT